MKYLDLPAKKAYELMNCGGLVLVCSKSPDGRYDLAPVAWACPLDYEPASRVLFVCDPNHATHANIESSRAFVLALPTPQQRGLVEKAGSVSARDADKYAAFGIESFPAGDVDALVPAGVAAWLECRLLRTVAEGSSSIVLGEVIRASAVPEAWKLRLHYASEGVMYSPGERL
jgi:flavin reductase (DIM6/NTAB) family NADH-FMN oxidoreductase RutF